MDKELFDLFKSRFDSLETSSKEQLQLLYGIDRKVAVNQAHITWLKWSLRGVWTSLIAIVGGWLGVR